MSINEAQFRELLQKYVNTDYNTLVACARDSLNKVTPLFEALDKDHNGSLLLVAILNAGIGADGQLTVKEKAFLHDAFGLEPATVDNLISLFTGKEFDLIDILHDKLDGDAQFHVFNIVAILAACDETIPRDEINFLRKVVE
jgi:uncharacterized tellurite resistance protein B-like protein